MPRYSSSEREKALGQARQRLMDAALVEFASNGYAEANINRISAAAGFAKGTIYNYFPSKQALMHSLIEETGAFHLAYIANRVLQAQDAVVRLEQFFEAGFAFVEQHPAQARFLITTLYSAEDEFKMAMYRTYQPMFQLVGQEIIATGVAEGVFRATDPGRTGALLMTLYLGVASNVDQNGKVWLSPAEVSAFALKAVQ
jgi:AcrR family transcriptional regulator